MRMRLNGNPKVAIYVWDLGDEFRGTREWAKVCGRKRKVVSYILITINVKICLP
jgi:hypothetical protein